MSHGAVVELRDLGQPEGTERSGNLLSEGRNWAELEVTDGGAPIPAGTMVGFQTGEAVCLGQVEVGQIRDGLHHLRVRVDHSLALQDISSIQKLWSQEQPD